MPRAFEPLEGRPQHVRRRVGDFPAVPGGSHRGRFGAGDLPRPEHQLLQALCGGDAGPHGLEQKLELPPAFTGNAYESDVQRFPHALRDAIAELEKGTMARKAFGDEVVDHYLTYARTEQAQFDKVVTGYERERLFERG